MHKIEMYIQNTHVHIHTFLFGKDRNKVHSREYALMTNIIRFLRFQSNSVKSANICSVYSDIKAV